MSFLGVLAGDFLVSAYLFSLHRAKTRGGISYSQIGGTFNPSFFISVTLAWRQKWLNESLAWSFREMHRWLCPIILIYIPLPYLPIPVQTTLLRFQPVLSLENCLLSANVQVLRYNLFIQNSTLKIWQDVVRQFGQKIILLATIVSFTYNNLHYMLNV